jgi:hypothetical protein
MLVGSYRASDDFDCMPGFVSHTSIFYKRDFINTLGGTISLICVHVAYGARMPGVRALPLDILSKQILFDVITNYRLVIHEYVDVAHGLMVHFLLPPLEVGDCLYTNNDRHHYLYLIIIIIATSFS